MCKPCAHLWLTSEPHTQGELYAAQRREEEMTGIGVPAQDSRDSQMDEDFNTTTVTVLTRVKKKKTITNKKNTKIISRKITHTVS